ncbi:uncharacterized protein TNCV_4282571 [Trichonephila clavipes]|nr:uncharacterized protein TNCV_4282571 [Trichonephila clavipes]
MSNLFDEKKGMIVEAHLAGVCVEEDSYPKTQDYTAADNVRDEYPLSKPCIHDKHSTGVACCKHSWQSSYSKTVSFAMECYKVPRPPKLDKTAMGTSPLV